MHNCQKCNKVCNVSHKQCFQCRKTNKVCKTCNSKFFGVAGNCEICRGLLNNYNSCSCGNKKSKTANWCKKCGYLNKILKPNTYSTYISDKGYVYVYVRDHPKCKNRSSKYIAEHVLVMEEHLGRYLEKGETVHHKNGVRNDNRLENLELWCKPQQPGIRNEDALKWALEVIKRNNL